MTQHEVGDYVYDDGIDLGEGTYGKVFRGHRKQNVNEMVAIKVINLNKSVVKRAGSLTTEREVIISEILTTTKHPNLVSFHCHKKVLSIIYLVMEFCNGGNLYEYLQAQESKTLTEKTIRRFFQQIGAGVKFLHEQDIIHRDLKPENILLDFYGPRYPAHENIRLKIGDFGLGRFLMQDEKATTNCGTLYYQAPEVASGNYDKKVDLWSIGMMIYECVVGTRKALEWNRVMLSTDVILRGLLINLLKQDPKERFDCDRFFNHAFIFEYIHVSIRVDCRTIRITIRENTSVDELYDKVIQLLGGNVDQDSIYLSYGGVPLVRGSGSSVEDARIRNGTIIEFNLKLLAGRICKQN